MKRSPVLAAVAIAILSAVCLAADEAEAPPSLPVYSPTPDRDRLAREIYRHDFENRRNPDTGLLLPESADMDNSGWPDFWEPVLAVGFPEYLIGRMRIAPDKSGQIPGAYRDQDNHALRMGFDGTRVGIRTREAVPVDSALAYELSLLHRDEGLEGGRIRAGVDWMRIDSASSRVLRSDEIPDLPTGQEDWPVMPARMLVNDVPPLANAARLFVIVNRRPESIGGSYNGDAWVDDIALRPLPKILVDAPRPAPGVDGQVIPIHYTGLVDNLPDPDNPGFFKGKRYQRRVDVTDVFSRPLNPELRQRVTVTANDDGAALEEIAFPRGRYGVYYFNIRLYDANSRLATDVMRAVAVMRPESERGGPAIRSGRPLFGVRTERAPEATLAIPGLLRRMLAGAGAKMTKLTPWLASYARPGDNNDYYRLLGEEIRGIRSGGIGVVGVVDPPTAMFDHYSLAAAIDADAEKLNQILLEAGRRLGLFMDSWQWGNDADNSLQGVTSLPHFEELAATLGEFSSGLPVIMNRRLGATVPGVFPLQPTVINAYFPATETSTRLWPAAAPVFPWLFEPYHNPRGATYPPARLASLAPPPAADLVEQQARNTRRGGSALSLELPAAYPHEPNAAAERTQLEQMLIRATYAAALAPDTVYLGELFDARHGLLRRDSTGGNLLETMARPAYLAAGIVSEMLEGAEYLGQIGLLRPYEAHAFRRPGGDAAVIVLWHNDATETRFLDRREIASGPPLSLVDWAGNVQALPTSIPVNRVPSFITGLSASLLLTRMSVRIAPDPRLLATTRRQNQLLEIVNHTPRQAPVLFRLRFAARPEDGTMENGWTVSPEELRANLPPHDAAFTPGRLRFSASPDPNSPLQVAGPGRVDKAAEKIARVAMTINVSPPADMLLYLPFRLQSEIDIDIEPLERVDDPHFLTLQLKLRWFPEGASRRRSEIKLLPYYVKRGRMKESAAFPVAVKALPPEERGNPDAPFDSVELRIPRQPPVQTWVGLTEDGGAGFYQAEVTDFLLTP